jgi:uncharacterized protein YjbI with pentapeptide repeats
MNHPVWPHGWGRRLVLLGAFAGASLWAAVGLGPGEFHEHLDTPVQTAATQLWRIRWVWPLAATTALALLTSPTARRRWPQRSRRVLLGLAGTVGMIGLIGFAVTARTVTVLLTLGGVLLVGLLATWMLVVPTWMAPALSPAMLDRLSDSERLDKADARLKLQNDLRTTALQAIAGLAVLAGAVLAYQQLAEDRQQAAADRELTRQGQASERFTRAISQLGSDRREVQLGGIYGLEQIAQQAPANRLAVTEVLVAYLHRRAPRPPKSTTGRPEELRVRAPDVQAALTVLGRRQTARGDPNLDLRALDLAGANLTGADLAGANLVGTDLAGAKLLHADLAGADLYRGNLTWANLHRADLSDAQLTYANLDYTNLHRTNFHRADLSVATLRGASLTGANLSKAYLSAANFSDAKLVRTDLSGADLGAAKFIRANLSAANLSGVEPVETNFLRANLSGVDLSGLDLRPAILRKAKADRSTRWPLGFDWRRKGVRMTP